MRVADVRIHPYRIPFRQPFVTAHGTLAAREGAIIELVTDDGITGIGDMAAVTEFGAADLPTLLRAMDSITSSLFQLEPQPDVNALVRWILYRSLKDETLLPALRFAIETAATDALWQTVEITERDRARIKPVLVNATVGVSESDAAADAARAAVTSGYSTVKLKVGMLDTVTGEIARIHAVRDAIGPKIQLRLDANEAWTFEQAREILIASRDLALEYVEQPLSRDHLAGMRALRVATGVPIAADEAITDVASVKRICEADAADVFILKPQLLGGLGALHSAGYLVMWHKKTGIVTSSLESGIGVAATLRMVARGPYRFVHPSKNLPACGLATLPLLEDDLILEDLSVVDGAMHVPPSPGMGVTLDRAALEKYRWKAGG
jgi:L-Ala-D/L-Glu epimerase